MKTLLAIFIGVAAVSAAYGSSGYFNFDNFLASGTVGIAIDAGPSAEGNNGDYFGSTYTAALYYSLTPVSGSVAPESLTLLAGSQTAFYGTTGSAPNHGPNQDGAGLFDGGDAIIPGTSDGQIIYTEVVVWYSGSGATSYAQAIALGENAGYTAAVAVRLASGTDPQIADTGVGALEINLVPEPSTIALGALGGAALLWFRKRK